MRRGLLVVGCWVAAAGVAHAQPAHLTPAELPANAIVEHEAPAIDLLTFGVGERIFETFGHAALCLRYANPDHPGVCFNYGVTDFTAGSVMIWDFVRMQQRFWAEPTSRSSMIEFYEAEDRDIWVQTLPIHGAQARALEDKLWHDVEEANRYYIYDHFYDNCTTRLRDEIDVATGGALRAGSDARYPWTFRELGRRGLADLPALLAISDLVIGRKIDDLPTVWEAMFLPDIFRQQIEIKLHVAPELVYRRQGRALPTLLGDRRGGPADGVRATGERPRATGDSTGRLGLLAIGIVLALPLVVAQWRRRWQAAALAWATLGLVALGGVVWGLVILSSIPAVRYNEAVLVMVPLDLALPWLGAVARRRYAQLRIAVLGLVSLLAAIGVLHQPLSIPILVVFLPMLTIALDLPLGVMGRRGGLRASPGQPAAATDAGAVEVISAAAPIAGPAAGAVVAAAVSATDPEAGAASAEAGAAAPGSEADAAMAAAVRVARPEAGAAVAAAVPATVPEADAAMAAAVRATVPEAGAASAGPAAGAAMAAAVRATVPEAGAPLHGMHETQ